MFVGDKARNYQIIIGGWCFGRDKAGSIDAGINKVRVKMIKFLNSGLDIDRANQDVVGPAGVNTIDFLIKRQREVTGVDSTIYIMKVTNE